MKTTAGGRMIARILWIVLATLIFLLSSLWYFRWDITQDKSFSLGAMSQELLASLNDPLRITYYVSPELEELYPHARDVKDFLRLYSLNRSQVQVQVKDPVKEGLENSLLQQGVFPHQIQATKGNSTQLVTVYSAVVLEYVSQMAVIPFVQTAVGLEYEMAHRLLKLVEGAREGSERGVWPVIVMSGNGLSLDEDYGDVVPWLEAAGFAPTVLTPEDFMLVTEQMDSRGIPVMLFGSNQLTASQVQAIRSFVEAGGKLFVMTSAHSAAMYDDWTVMPTEDKLLPVLSSWGLEVGPELVLDISCFRATFLSEEENPVYQQVNYPLWIQALPQYTVEHSVSRRAFNLEFYWSSPITLTSMEAQALVYTSPFAWLSSPDFSKESVFVTNPFMLPQSASQAGQLDSQYALAAMTSLPGGGQVLVVGSQYFLSTLMRQYTGSLGNLDFTVKGLLQLCGKDSLLELKNKASLTKTLYKVSQQELESRRPRVLILNLIILPLLPAFIALVWWLCTRGKRGESLPYVSKKHGEGHHE